MIGHQQVDVDHALGMPRGENALYSAQICLSRAACLGILKADGAAAVDDISLPRDEDVSEWTGELDRVAIVVYIGFRYNAPTQFRYIHIYIHQI